jgi:virulence-associated protein VapD
MQQPYYTIELSVVACNFEVLVNDIPVLAMEVEGQIAPNLPLNFAICKTGEQNLTVVMRPLKKQKKIQPSAELKYNVRLYDVSNDEFDFVKDFEEIKFPKVDPNNDLTILENTSKFYAEVPYELTRWDEGVDLKDVKDVEKKLKQAYYDIGGLVERENFVEFEKKVSLREQNMATAMYLSPIEIKSRINSLINDVKNGFKIKPLPKDMLFRTYGYGKIGAFKSVDGEPVISLYNEEKKEELMLELMFYIPDGKTEFEVI